MNTLKRALVVLVIGALFVVMAVTQTHADISTQQGWVSSRVYAYSAEPYDTTVCSGDYSSGACTYDGGDRYDFEMRYRQVDKGEEFPSSSLGVGIITDKGNNKQYWLEEPDVDPSTTLYGMTRGVDGIFTFKYHDNKVDVYLNKDIDQSLVRNEDEYGSVWYDIDTSKSPDITIDGGLVNAVTTVDKRYIIASYYLKDDGLDPLDTSYIAKYDTQTGVRQDFKLRGWDSYEQEVKSVTNDGRYVIDGDAIYDTGTCGRSDGVYECPKVVVNDLLAQALGTDEKSSSISYPVFSNDGKSLNILVSRDDPIGYYPSIENYYTLTLNKRLTYLALGDSFSSGEGDLTPNGAGYRWGTNVDGKGIVPTEKCHVSLSSYPYRLASQMNYGSSEGDTANWGSVACSGAVTTDIGGGGAEDYKGQRQNNIPRLTGYGADSLKTEALNEMIPGRQKQIEFVKKYQPKAVTMSVGGNDVQFADIVRACVSPDTSQGGEVSQVCSYAKDSSKKSYIGYSIASMQNKLVDLYQEILAAGPDDMKLYIIGYPDFVSKEDSDSRCGPWVGLTRPEREMIIESTEYLNNIARYAADFTGAIYISTETSLGNHVLCGMDSKKAVNGIVVNDQSESFHPNVFGHQLMADRIAAALGGDKLDSYICRDSQYVTCPGGSVEPVRVPDYFASAMEQNPRAVNDQEMTKESILTAGKRYLLTLRDSILDRYSYFSVFGFTDKYDLGTYQADDDGGFSGEIILPRNMSTGYHTLVVEGTDTGGQPVNIWKIIYVNGTDQKVVVSSSKVNITLPQTSSRNQSILPSMESNTQTTASTTREDSRGSETKALGGHGKGNEELVYIVGLSLIFAILAIWQISKYKKADG